jgi:L-malate glycosyltransferase
MSILEAYASGLAVVSTDPGGIPYIVEDKRTGRLVACGNAESLAGAALEVIERPQLFAELTRNALAECVKYTWESVQPAWTRLYTELAPSDTVLGARAV